jgi:hypothetical protein
MIKHITYQGEKYPIRVSYYAMVKFKEQHGMSIEKLTDNDVEKWQDILFYALVAGHKVTKEEMNLEREDMIFVLDECFMEFMKLVPTFFQGTNGPQQAVEGGTRANKTKQGTKSK